VKGEETASFAYRVREWIHLALRTQSAWTPTACKNEAKLRWIAQDNGHWASLKIRTQWLVAVLRNEPKRSPT
jgi:hypothetical protein